MTTDDNPLLLYHYTTTAGAHGILSGGAVWASMIHYMNDAQEFQYALALARELIQSATESSEESRLVCDDFLSAIRRITIFVFSLTENKDQLSQWRAYSLAGGYAVGFAKAHLSTIAAGYGASLVKCDYDPASQREKLAPIVADMLEAAIPGGFSAKAFDDFAVRFARVAAAIKHPSFREEQEWRIVSASKMKPELVRYRHAGGVIVPYCEWSLRQGSTYPIATVVVGPTIPGELAARSLHYLTAQTFGWPVKVEFSDSPLRPLT
jgi:hypothetical protein